MKEGEKTAEINAVIETYGKNVSYIDFDALNPIIDEIQLILFLKYSDN